ncbi:ABC transporter ATP-binding protein [Mesonia sp. K7]|uniref:ABC transporter ATP-binding protein n=1 Tax=Mesonia sp. K7 TaxID=2218606 RepID=UPI000DA986D4|nr:ATP-binding cassette domain-containing protein [Mesonia sp. K7]PZD77391.1 ABC transporter ATP-binding protein [Mesonia sp. K7]
MLKSDGFIKQSFPKYTNHRLDYSIFELMLHVKNLHFSYYDQPTLQNISFRVEKGEHVCVIGESGCGKSTLLKAVYGLIDIAQGEIFWNNDKILGPAFQLIPGHQKLKYLAQEAELMPYTSVEENIKKYLSRQYPEKSQQRCDELLEVIDMVGFNHRKVKNLSGGQKQRVAIAQALAKEPQLLLLDEPFNFIDNFRKNKLRRNLFNYMKKESIACLFATHDSEDMFAYADTALVLKDGKLLANNTPKNLYEAREDFYISSLFEEVNTISQQLWKPNSNQNLLAYVSDFAFAENGKIKAKVLQNYPGKKESLIESITKETEQKILFWHDHKFRVNEMIRIDFKDQGLLTRLLNASSSQS